MKTIAAENTPMNKQKNTSDQSAEIQAAEIKVAEAERQNAFASKALNLSLLAYVIITAVLAATTFWGSRAAERLKAAEKLLNDLQKAKIGADSELQTKVETQRVREEAASELKIKTEEVRGEAAVKIEQARGEAETKIAEANRRTEEVRQQNLATESRLEKERETRLELEKSLAPRVLRTSTYRGEDNWEPLKGFAGVNVEIECLPDAEPRRLAGSLGWILKRAGWNVSYKTVPDPDDPWREGVRIDSTKDTPGYLAGNAVVAFLMTNGINAVNWPPRMPWREDRPADNSLRIIVSLKPDPYFKEQASNESWQEVLKEWRQVIGEERWEEFERKDSEQREDLKKRMQADAEELWNRLWADWRKMKAAKVDQQSSETNTSQ